MNNRKFINKILQGDCLKLLKEMEDNSVDSIVTDPPYGLVSIVKRFGKKDSAPAKFGTDGAFSRASRGFMGKRWDGTGIENNVDMWEECLRVLKPGGYLLSFGGTRTYHRMACAIEDAGFEIRDMIEWVYGSGFPKSHNIGKAVDKLQGNKREVVGKEEVDVGMQSGSMHAGRKSKIVERDKTKGTSEWEGWGTALKPAHEPICMARKPLGEKTVAENCLKWGTGGINIDECRLEVAGRKTGTKNPNAQKGSGNCYQGSDGKKQMEYDTKTQGRFPANLIHDNSEEVRECFPETKSGKPNGQKTGYRFNVGERSKGGDTTWENSYGDQGNASRFFKSIKYCAKASKSERNAGCEGLGEKNTQYKGFGLPDLRMENLQNRIPNSNNHPTVKPIPLMQYLIKMVTPKGGTVLDPFMGSGSTGCACVLEGFDFIGIEMADEYITIAHARIDYWKNMETQERLAI